MATAITQEPLHLIDVDAIVVALGGSELSGPAQELNTQTDGALQRMIDANEASLKVGVTTSWLAPSGIKAPVVMLVGLGSCDSPENISYFKAAGAAAKTLAAKQRNTVAYYFPECDAAALETGVSGSLIGCHGQDICRSKRDLFTPDNILWATSDELTVENGVIIAQGINLTRDLVNGPPNMVYPETFAEQIQSLGETTSLEIEVWDAAKLAEEQCGSLLAVAQGSAREARLVIMRYRGSDVADPQLALVGKGVTYDSGGLSLKPSDGQKTMKCDMGGAATVVGTMQAISQLKLPCHVIGLVGLVENMVSSNAYRLGDVITARNGKTIEMKVRLGMPADLFPNDPMAFRFGGSDGLNGPLNQRRDDFPAAIQHDSVLLPSQCGGPVVNVSGEVIGINVARANRIVSYALPCGTVRKIVAEARSMLAETETKSDTTTN